MTDHNSLTIQAHEIEKIQVNLGVVLNAEGKVLVIRRVKKEPGKDGSVLQWAFPGGKSQMYETPEESAAREILIETGYAVKIQKLIITKEHPQIPVSVSYFLGNLLFPDPISTPQEPEEIAEVKWVNPQELPHLFTTVLNPEVARELGVSV